MSSKDISYEKKLELSKILLLNLILVGMLTLLYFKPLIGGIAILLITINLFVFKLLKPFPNEKDEDSVDILPIQELNNSTRLLRYATAALSFISLLTTANGMKSFVFGQGEGWLAYLCSFAVQSILVIFSLLLCHFYFVIGKTKSLGESGKRLLLGALTTFFAVALLISSSFSYSYIAGNAYAASWNGDCEVMIQTYLMREAGLLKQENEQRGRVLLDSIIGQVGSDLGSAVDTYSTQCENDAKDQVKRLVLPDYNFKDISIDETIAGLGKRYTNYAEELERIRTAYTVSFYSTLQDCNTRYTDVVTFLSSLSGTDLTADQKVLEQASLTLHTISGDIQNPINNISTLETYMFRRDLNLIKTNFKSEAERFQTFVNTQISLVDKVLNAVTDANVGITSTSTKSIYNQVDDIQSRIYLLETPKGISSSAEIRNISADISTLFQSLANADALSANDIKPLISLSNQLEEYGKYLDLADELKSYLDKDLTETYFFSGNGSVTPDVWRSARDGDFNQFFSMLKKLPDQSVVTEIYNEQKSANPYESATTLNTASRLRRDLLGDITSFERSINYFKYDFSKMAFFSAFIAVFLDLGAFLTGCFLYGTRHVKAMLEKSSEVKTFPGQQNDSITDKDGQGEKE